MGLMLHVGVAAHAESIDDDMPPPQDRVESELPLGEAPAQEVGPRDDVGLPNPSLGEEALPEPKEEQGREKSKNLVNKAPEEDDIFLPTPAVNDNINYAPIGQPVAGRVTAEDLDWRMATGKRPIFQLMGGFGTRNYVSDQVRDRPFGYLLGASLRLFDIAQTVYLHTFANFQWENIGDVGPYAQVHNRTFRIGGMLEIGLGRRWSLYGSLFRRADMLSSNRSSLEFDNARRDLIYLANVGEKPNWLFGVGLQYDFWVIPHGSMGVLGTLERDCATVLLTLAIEPAPRKRISLNFEEM